MFDYCRGVMARSWPSHGYFSGAYFACIWFRFTISRGLILSWQTGGKQGVWLFSGIGLRTRLGLSMTNML